MCSHIWSTSKNVPCTIEKTMNFAIVGWNVLYISVTCTWSKLCFNSNIFLFIFCLDYLSIANSRVQMPPTVVVCCCFCSCHSMQLVESLFPDQGSNPSSLQWKYRVQTAGHPGNSLPCYIVFSFSHFYPASQSVSFGWWIESVYT